MEDNFDYQAYLRNNPLLKENKSNKGLMVFGKTQLDNNKIKDFIQNSDFTAEWKADGGYWLFDEDPELYDELEKQLDSEFASLDINARFEGIFESNDNNIPGPGADVPHKEEAPESFQEEISSFLNELKLILKEFPSSGYKDEIWNTIHDDIYSNFPPNYEEFTKMYENLLNNKEFIQINNSFKEKFDIDINDDLEVTQYRLESEDDINESKINELIIKSSDIIPPQDVKPGMNVWNDGEYMGIVLDIQPAKNFDIFRKHEYEGFNDIKNRIDKGEFDLENDYFIVVDLDVDLVIAYYGPHDFYVLKDNGGNRAPKEDAPKSSSSNDRSSMNEITKFKELVKKTLKEMSVTGGGGAGASFSAGVGMNYATPKAFNKLKKKK